uniref:Uncharacterized protein n=1 Tax=Candidatus Kentrum sp. LPFa TaxID=2126335 RepID=A0A450Y1C8_9GAMM|nr:MAG: hypothetical protein BECKLPF1236A_GA0070988_102145 [Candidatus Kentron sp. LPFa]VFK35348.1 MAG: hypothetical protein BECKLPF1236C_GA0070990_103631 [Candidatus Kentron sp. LPFa]
MSSLLGKYVDYSLDLITDGDAVNECMCSLLSFGLTSNDVTRLYLSSKDPLFEINENNGETYISIKENGTIKDFSYNDESQHGIILITYSRSKKLSKYRMDYLWRIESRRNTCRSVASCEQLEKLPR